MFIGRLAAVVVLVLGGAACGSDGATDATPAATTPATTAPPSRTAAPVVDAAARVQAEQARGKDPSALSSGIVHVRADGAIEILLHTKAIVTPAQLDELRRLGAEVVVTTPTPAVAGQQPASLVQVWVPAGQVAAVDALPWVVAVTAPSYGTAGG